MSGAGLGMLLGVGLEIVLLVAGMLLIGVLTSRNA
jgi:hypothetical protein